MDELDRIMTYEDIYNRMFEDIMNKEYNEASFAGGGGRSYFTPKDLAINIRDYFLFCHYNSEVISMHGLCIYLGLWSPQALAAYLKMKQYTEDFRSVVIRTRTYIEKTYVDKLFDPRSFNAARFVLQCKYKDWIPTEKSIVENHDIIVNIGKPKEDDNSEPEEEEYQ